MSELNTLALPPGWGDPYMSHNMMHEEGRRRAGRDTAMDLSHPAGAAPPWAPHFGSLAPQYARRSKSPPPRRGPSHQLHPQQPQPDYNGPSNGHAPQARQRHLDTGLQLHAEQLLARSGSGPGGPWGQAKGKLPQLPHAGPYGGFGGLTTPAMGPYASPFGIISSRNSQMDTATGYLARR
jgi:hypothetical protein